jgi:hypothetical protein
VGRPRMPPTHPRASSSYARLAMRARELQREDMACPGAHDTAPVPQEQEGGAGASPRAMSGCSPESPAFPSERIPPLRAGAGPSSRSPGTC